MAKTMERVTVWFDKEGDFLELLFSGDPGYMRGTDAGDVMERVNAKGEMIGFSIMNVSRSSKDKPVVASLIASR